jgi:hypothetical protein
MSKGIQKQTKKQKPNGQSVANGSANCSLVRLNNGQKALNNSKPLPPLPKKVMKEAKDILVYDKSIGRRWWNDTGDLLYNLGSKAFSHGLKLLTGFGDYELTSNSLVAAATHGVNGNGVPIMKNSKVANIIRHREYIGDVIGSTSNFSIQKYSINPGLDKTFPWLQPIAHCYTNYRMRGMVMEFVSLATEYSAVPYIGYVAMATQYNSLDPIFTDKKSMENSEYANSCKPSQNMSHPIECASDQLALTELYIRNNQTNPKADPRLYDLGQFSIAVGGQASETIIGELWATYEVEFYFPKLASTVGMLHNTYRQYLGIYTNALPFGATPPALSGLQGSTFALKSATSTEIILPEECIGQTFEVVCTWAGTQATVAPPTVTGVDASILNYNVSGPQGGVTNTTVIILNFFIKLDKGKPGGFSFATNGLYPPYINPINSTLFICQVPDGIIS